MVAEEVRFAGLKRRLQELRYDLPLGLESAPLVESLVSDLTHANQRIESLQSQIDAQAHSLIVAENQAHPLRKENGRLLRENNQLHLELIKKAEDAEKLLQEQQALGARLQKQNTDLSFISTQQVQRIRALEEANAGLRERFNEALQQNGVVLPSGHEVRWHGRKEHMQAHSPVPAAPRRAAEEGGQMQVDPAAASLLEASERQVTGLQARLQELQEQAAAMQEELGVCRQQVATRDDEIARLSAQLEGGRDFDRLSLKHIEESRKQAIAQLNGQVQSRHDANTRWPALPARALCSALCPVVHMAQGGKRWQLRRSHRPRCVPHSVRAGGFPQCSVRIDGG